MKNSPNRGVLQSRGFNGCNAPAWAKFVTRFKGNWYFEESLSQDIGKRFLRIGGIDYDPEDANVPVYGSRTQTGYEYYYELPRNVTMPVAMALPYGVDDGVLPAAPTSGMYFSTTGKRRADLEVRKSFVEDEESKIVLSIDGVYRKVRMSAETARAMAYDLYRMARQIEKENIK